VQFILKEHWGRTEAGAGSLTSWLRISRSYVNRTLISRVGNLVEVQTLTSFTVLPCY